MKLVKIVKKVDEDDRWLKDFIASSRDFSLIAVPRKMTKDQKGKAKKAVEVISSNLRQIKADIEMASLED